MVRAYSLEIAFIPPELVQRKVETHKKRVQSSARVFVLLFIR